VLPNFRSSNDGRLFTDNAGTLPGIGVFRPENLGYDAQQLGNGDGWGENPQRNRQALFPGAWLPVAETLFDLGPNAPAAYHNTLCDDSSSVFDLSESNSSARNPRSCSAWVSLETWPPHKQFDPQNAELISGDCYDVSMLVNAGKDSRWELSTTDLTVFVPNGKEPSSGEPGLYTYPRMAGDVLPFNGDYTPFNFHYDASASTWDWSWQFERDKIIEKCVNTPASQRPLYCAYQSQIETSAETGFVFDKNANGQIDSGELWNGNSCSAPNAGSNCNSYALFEPSVTADGRLLVLNGAGLGLWYSYSENACSANGWRFFRPVSAMPYDSRLIGRYGIAATPFRDTDGSVLAAPASGQPFPEFSGAYPWIDRQGRNLFWARINDARDGYVAINATPPCPAGTSDYDCAHEPDLVGQELVPDESPGKGFSVVGSWTRGKIVHLDNRLNLSVFGNKRPKNRNSSYRFRHEWDMQLYQGASTHIAPVGATTLLSPENLFNGYEAFSPTQPFDVVWTLSTNHQQTPEVVFDEYMSSNAFIVVPMNAPFTTFGNNVQPFWDDGFVPSNPNKSVRFDGPGSADFRFRRSPRLQNASTLPTEVQCPNGFTQRPEGCRLLAWSASDGVQRYYAASSSELTLIITFDGGIFNINYCPAGSLKISSVLSGNQLTQVCKVLVPGNVQASQLTRLDNGLYLIKNHNRFGLIPPSDLELLGGARIEPLADGGVIGNGLWLDGKNDHAHAEFPNPPIHDWYVGAWFDDRSEDDQRRTLFTFADGSRIFYRQGELAAWHRTSNTWRTVDLSRFGLEQGTYFHLGVKIVTAGTSRRLYLYINGTRLTRTLSFPAEPGHLAFDMTCLAPESHFWLGDPGDEGAKPPFRGWVDELRVYALGPAERPTPSWIDEQVCNLAMGTLVEIKDSDRRAKTPQLRELWQRADDYGLFARAITAQGKSAAIPAGPVDPADKLIPVARNARVCEQLDVWSPTEGPSDMAAQHGDRLCVDRVHRNPRPALSERCLRQEIYGTAGRHLIADQPRPEFGDLPFCQSCHTDLSLIPELLPDALSAGNSSVPRYADPRRQPLDWSALLTGCRPTSAPFDANGSCDPAPELLDFLLSDGNKVTPQP
jgi:hypothetical protein